MDHRTRTTCAWGVWATLLTILVGCSSPSPNGTDCGDAQPTFRLIVDAEDAPVPGDVQIQVRYGSGEESFDARAPEASLKVVFCELERSGTSDAGASDAGAEGPIDRVRCDLWTDGAATVRVNAKGYPEVVRDLEADWDDKCGIVPSEAHITLEFPPVQ